MRRRLAAGMALGVCAQLSSIGLLLTSAWLIVRAAEHPPVMYLMVAIVSVRFFGVGRAVFHYGERLLTHDAVLAATTEERLRTYRELDRVAPFGLDRQRRGDVISRIVGDVDSAQDQLLRLRLPWVYALVSSGAVVILLVFIDPVVAAIVTAHVSACAAAARLGVSRADRSSRLRAAGLRGALSADASSVVLASPDLVAYGAGEVVRERATRTIDELSAVQRSAAWIVGAGTAFALVSTGATILLVALVSSGTPAALVGVVLLAPVALIEPLDSLNDAERLRPEIVAARTRLDELGAVPTPVDQPAHPRPLPRSNRLVARDLVAGWDRPVTAPMSFTLERGDIVGITGASGVGKSTLAATLIKLVESRSGSITLGGIDFADLDGSDIRTRIGMSGQDDVVFDTTIRENLRIADPEATDREMLAALDRSGLGAFVRQLPRTLDATVGEGGGQLSGGERQRLGIARLLLAEHAVLVFDEPTEHLDRPTADLVLSDIVTLAEDHAVLIISHSAEALSRCHRVVTVVGVDTEVDGPTHARRITSADVHV